MGEARRNPRSAQGKRGAARDQARLRQYLAGCCSAGELRAFVEAVADPADRARVFETCWPLTTFGANQPFPGYPAPPATN